MACTCAPATVTLSVPFAGQYTQVAVTRAGDGASRSGPASYIQGAQQVSPAMAPATAAPSVPGPGDGGSGSYVTDIANGGIIAPEPWQAARPSANSGMRRSAGTGPVMPSSCMTTPTLIRTRRRAAVGFRERARGQR